MTEWELPGILRRIRRVADLSQRQLAQELGLSKSGVAAVESGVRDLDVRVLVAAAALAGMRLALLDADGREVAGMAPGTARDGAGRRFPAHLDTALTDERYWGEHRRDRPVTAYTAQRDRRRRDSQRAWHGTPDDHLVPEPGDSPAERRAARRAEVRRRVHEEWERRRAAGELPPLQDPVCTCPRDCDTGVASGRAVHTDDCVCGCDVG
ncbi:MULTISPECIES: helix-turn-helix domain-containing protein [unclassified Blastococcus]